MDGKFNSILIFHKDKDISLIYSYFQYGQDPLLRQLSKQTGENFDLSPPSGRGDPLLRQLVRNGDYKVVNLEPPRPLTNTFDTLREAARKKTENISFNIY